MVVTRKKEDGAVIVSDNKSVPMEDTESLTRKAGLERQKIKRLTDDEKRKREDRLKSNRFSDDSQQRHFHSKNSSRVKKGRDGERKRVIQAEKKSVRKKKKRFKADRTIVTMTRHGFNRMEELSDAEYNGKHNSREDSEYTGNGNRAMLRTVKAVAAIVIKELIVLVKAVITAMTNIIGVCILCVVVVIVSVSAIIKNMNISGSDEVIPNQEYSASAQGVVNIACSYADKGIAETGNNNVIFNTRYYGQEVSGSQYSWCVVFVYCCFEDAFGERADEICSKTAVVSDLKATLLEHGGTEIPIDQGQPGDIIGFSKNGDYKHCGIIIENLGNGMYKTVEGNTSAVGSESQDNGDGVYKKVRVPGSYFQIAYIVRPNYPDPVYVVNDSDENLLAALICSEGGTSYEDKLAVGTVVMNRLDEHLYGAQTLQDVIYAPSQFSGTKTETFRNALQYGAPEECLQIAHQILYEGKRSSLIPASCISFRALSISEHEMRRMTGCENFIIIDQRFGW